MKIVYCIFITSLGSFIAASYTPLRYERFLAQSKAALQARKKIIEQRLPSLRAHHQKASQEKSGYVIPRPVKNFQAVIDASGATINTLEATLKDINTRLAGLEELKKNLPKLTIKDAKAETALLKKMAAQETIADIGEQLNEIGRTQQFVENLPATEVDPKALADLRKRWADDRSKLQTRLKLEQAITQGH